MRVSRFGFLLLGDYSGAPILILSLLLYLCRHQWPAFGGGWPGRCDRDGADLYWTEECRSQTGSVCQRQHQVGTHIPALITSHHLYRPFSCASFCLKPLQQIYLHEMSLLRAATAGYCVDDVIIIESNLNLGHQKEGSTDISPAQGFFLSKGEFFFLHLKGFLYVKSREWLVHWDNIEYNSHCSMQYTQCAFCLVPDFK